MEIHGFCAIDHMLGLVREALALLFADRHGSVDYQDALNRVDVVCPKSLDLGHFSTNAAMLLAHQLGMTPRAIGQQLADELLKHSQVQAVQVVGAGFVNIFVTPSYWSRIIAGVLASGDKYGYAKRCDTPVNVEYVSANPTGPLHVAHARGAVLGDVVSNVLQATGHQVCREYYINDTGEQIRSLLNSVYKNYCQLFGRDVSFDGQEYPGEYVRELAVEIKGKVADALIDLDCEDWMPRMKQMCLHRILEWIKSDLDLLGVRHDVFSNESTMHASGRIEQAIEALKVRGRVYEGRLPKPLGYDSDDWESREQMLFRGAEQDRPLQKANGEWTYFAADIAYHWDKYQRGFKQQINVLGADHGGYVARISEALKAVTDGDAHLKVFLYQIVHLIQAGKVVRMSKRAGNFMSIKDLIQMVGKDAVRFLMLTRTHDTALDFDCDMAVEKSNDNPVFYVQYASARINSVLRKAREIFPDMEELSHDATGVQCDCSLLSSDEEIIIMMHMCKWPSLLRASAYQPHRIVTYCTKLAELLHQLWTAGNMDKERRFIIANNPELSMARLVVLSAVRNVLYSALSVVGVAPLDSL